MTARAGTLLDAEGPKPQDRVIRKLLAAAAVLGLVIAGASTAVGHAARSKRPGCRTLYPHEPCSQLGLAIHDLIVDPKNPKVIALFVGDAAWISTNGGKSWRVHRLPAEAAQYEYGDYSADGAHAFSGDGTIIMPLVDEVAISKDLARTWTFVPLTTSVVQVGHVVSDPSSPSTLWACADAPNSGTSSLFSVAKSSDDGSTWTVMYTLPIKKKGAETCSEIAVSRSGRVILVKGNHHLFRSKDGGDTWQRVPGVAPYDTLGDIQQEVAFDPTRPNIVLALDWKRNHDCGCGGKRLVRSTNSGATWRPLRQPKIPSMCVFMRVAFSSTGTALATTDCALFFVSKNHGRTWRQITMPPVFGATNGFKWGFRDGFGDQAQTLEADGRSIIFFALPLLQRGVQAQIAPFWKLSPQGTAMKWHGGWGGR